MKETTYWAIEVILPKLKSGYTSPYREQKIAAHTTRSGKGKVARIKKGRLWS